MQFSTFIFKRYIKLKQWKFYCVTNVYDSPWIWCGQVVFDQFLSFCNLVDKTYFGSKNLTKLRVFWNIHLLLDQNDNFELPVFALISIQYNDNRDVILHLLNSFEISDNNQYKN